MYITINNVIGSERIDLSYPIRSGREGPRSVEIAVITMLSDNVQYLLKEAMKIKLKTGEDVALKKGVYTNKELNAIIGPELKLGIESHEYVLRTNKLENVTEMTISLEKLDNSDNLEDGRPSNTLFTYYVTSPEYSTHFEPHTPQYKKLKYGTITSLTLRMMDQAGNIITNGLGTTVVLQIR